MGPGKSLEISVKRDLNLSGGSKGNIIVAEAGPIEGTKTTFTFTTNTPSGDIVATITQPYEAILEHETKEFMIDTVERSKKHFIEGLKFSFVSGIGKGTKTGIGGSFVKQDRA